jgi:hypothetical protein
MKIIALLMLMCCQVSSAAVAEVILKQATYPVEREGERANALLIDSRWGFIQRFNTALVEQLQQCNKDDVQATTALLELGPHRFGENSLKAISYLKDCRPDINASIIEADQVSRELWTAVAPATTLPSVIEKAKAIAFAGAGPNARDYNLAFWNADARPELGEDPREVFTWGPAKATVVDGCFVQKILRTVAAKPNGSELLTTAFAQDPEALSIFLDASCDNKGAAFIKLGRDISRRNLTAKAFEFLGNNPVVRDAYDETYLRKGGPWFNRINDYYLLYKEADIQATETDFAFILELARGTPLPLAEFAARAAKIRGSKPSTPAEVRRGIVGLMKFSSPASRKFVQGRMVSYFIDGFGEDKLSGDEISAWRDHSRIRASNVGLSDEPFTPCEILPDLTICK